MIIDAHVHFYDPTRPQGVPWPKPGDVIYRQILPRHYKSIAVPLGVSGVVVMEASPWLEDNQWMLDLAKDETLIWAVIGKLDLDAEDYARDLARFTSNPLFRGIRLDADRIRSADHGFRSGIERLAAAGLVLEVLTRPPELSEVVALADRFPKLPIVLNHLAGVPIDGRPPATAWAANIRLAAQHPQVYAKVSRLLESAESRPAPTGVSYYAPVLDVLFESFGAERLIYGSNWPPCERCASLAAVQQVTKEYFVARGPAVVARIFGENARRLYKLRPRRSEGGDPKRSRTESGPSPVLP